MPLLTLLGTFGPISIIVTLVILAELSRRLGDVLSISSAYRAYYLAAFCCLVSVAVRLYSLQFSTEDFRDMSGNHLVALLYSVPLAISVGIGVIVTWYYWGWLVYASDGQLPFNRG
jgi:hypothetical protein